jgi:molybdenum cofactor biosynthesis enzyme MoaA
MMATDERPEPRRFLDTWDAARLLNLSHRTLEKFRVTGGGPVYRKLGRRVVYAIEDLERWAEEGRRRSTSEAGPRRAAGR